MLVKILKSILKILLLANLTDCQNNDCCFHSDFAYRDNQAVTLANYESFNQLKFNCVDAVNTSILTIHPRKQIILDNSLNLKGAIIRVTGRINTTLFFAIVLKNIKGFDLNSNSFEPMNMINYKKENIMWFLLNSNFYFYLNSSEVGSSNCNAKLPNWSLILKTWVLELKTDVIFSSQTCPYIFKNCLLDLINIQISSSLTGENKLGFQNISAPDLNSTIIHLNIKLYHTDLNEMFLNRFVFKNLQVLDVNGAINFIQADLFKSFERLGMLRLRTQNAKSIFARDNKWLSSLNPLWNRQTLFDVFVMVVYQAFSNVTYYEYPDEDFCHFKLFPHEKQVVPMLKPIFKSKCTCLELFLIQHSTNYGKAIKYLIDEMVSVYEYSNYYLNVIYENKFSKCINSSFDFALLQCNFTKRLNNCAIEQTSKQLEKNSYFFFYIYDWVKMSDLIEIVFPKYINLALTIVGIAVNSILIAVFSNRKIMPEKMYAYLLINSYFNFFYSLILLSKYTVVWLKDDFSLFYYNFYHTIYSQFLSLILSKFLLNVIRTASNISYFLFSLSRYLTITNKKGKYTDKFNRLSMKAFLFVMLTISVLINIQVFDQFKIRYSQTDIQQMHEFDSRKYSDYYKVEPIGDYKENFSSKSEFIILNVAQYVRMIFSDLAHMIVSSLIDVFLFFFVKRRMQMKKNLMQTATILSLVSSQMKRKKMLKTTRKSKDRISQMIILNGINFLVLKLPLAIWSFYGFVFRYNKESRTHEPSLVSYILCKNKKLCANLQEIFLCFYFVSFLFQFFIFYRLDNNFRLSFYSLKKNVSFQRNESSQIENRLLIGRTRAVNAENEHQNTYL